MTEFDANLDDIAERLRQERPVPRPGFRGDLKRNLLRTRAPLRNRFKLLIGAYASSGTCLLLVAAAGVAGIGPLA